jgi:S-DNA-T family DNA segregation ATPase FtsK/SpoIIIE
MRIELTACFRERSADLAVTASGSAPLRDVLPLVARAVGAPADASVWLGDQLLAPTSSIAASGLCTGVVVHLGERPPPDVRRGVLALQVVGGPAAGTVRTLDSGRLTIGRATDCGLSLPDPDVSRRHAALEVTATAITLHDLGSTNGTRLDGALVPPGGVRVRLGGLITLGDSVLTVAGPGDPPAAVQPGDDATTSVLRAPRRVEVAAGDEIALPNAPDSNRPRGMQWIGALLPAAAGGVLAWVAHTPQFLLFALLSPVMIVSTTLGDRVHWRRTRRRDAASYRTRRAATDRRIAQRLADEATARRRSTPDAPTVLHHAELPGCRLWERRRGDVDALTVRVGLAAAASALRVRDNGTQRPAGTLHGIPACVDLRRGPLGIAGPPAVSAGIGRWLIGQLAVLHSPADLDVVLLLDPARTGDWTWARWLPQLRGRAAASEDEVTGVVAALAAMLEQRLSGRPPDPAGWPGPWTVLVLDRAGRLGDVPGLAALLTRGAAAGITALCFDPDVTALPTACAAVAQVCGPTGTRLHVRGPAAPAAAGLVADQVSAAWATRLARALAPLRDAGTAGQSAVPDRCGLLDLLDMVALDERSVDARWRHAPRGARAVLGVGDEGPVEVDLARDGPHALVAGTTGSGKSELLQTLVAGLAVNHPPDELTVLLVDYKGGAAFAQCVRLPHTVGLVTDLDQYLTERALRALTSELRRRERAFAAARVADLAGYSRAAPADSIPRLVIVVDEFAALAEELPDFVRGLVAVAQRGRSLGVHLVLATQRPGTAVSADVRANTDMRIALRVTDPAESNDVLGSPEAAFISRAHPGRGFVRTGGTLTGFQTAQASSTAAPVVQPGVAVSLLGPWRRADAALDASGQTQLERVVDALQSAATRTGRRSAHSIWLPPLPDALPTSELEQPAGETTIALGRVDLPDEQRAELLTVDLTAGGSVLLVGGPHSGRTTTLAAAAIGSAERLSPDAVQLQVIDPAGALARAIRVLPHCATVLDREDAQLGARLLQRLAGEAADRIATPAVAGPARPALVLLIDGWETLCAALSDIDAAHCGEMLSTLLRLGPAAAVTVFLTGDRGALSPRIAGSFAERYLLRLTDRSDYALAGIRSGAVPSALPPGRAVRTRDSMVVQFAHPGAGAADALANQRAADAAAARWADRPRTTAAIALRPLPPRVRVGDVPAQRAGLVLGVGGDGAEPIAVDPFAGQRRILVAGPPRSGRSTLLRTLAQQAHDAGLATLLAAPARSPLAADAARLGIRLITPAHGRAIDVACGHRLLLLVDDCEQFTDTGAGDGLTALLREPDVELATVVSARADDLATSYRGLGPEVRRSHCGVLLRPGPVDGELLGVRLPRRPSSGPPGRGVAVGDPSWGPLFAAGEPVPIQVAAP